MRRPPKHGYPKPSRDRRWPAVAAAVNAVVLLVWATGAIAAPGGLEVDPVLTDSVKVAAPSVDEEPSIKIDACAGDALGCATPDVTLESDALPGQTGSTLPPAPAELTSEPAADKPAAEEAEETDGHPGKGSASSSGKVFEIELFGIQIIMIGQTSSQASDDGASSDATVLSVAGVEVIGAHSESEDGESHSETGYLQESCEATGGQLCVAVLWGQATTSDDEDSSHGDSDTAVASACVGGSEEQQPNEDCEGPVSASVLDSHSESDRDKANNTSDASEETNGAQVCVGGRNEEGICDGLGATVLHSESEAHARPGESDSDGGSYVLGIEQGGSETRIMEDEEQISVPPDCPDGSAVCITLNEGGSRAEAEGSGHEQTVIDIGVLTGEEDEDDAGGGTVGQTGAGASVSPDDEEEAPKDDDEVLDEGPQERGPSLAPQQGALPVTGTSATTTALAGLGLILIGLGAYLTARRRVGSRG